jgi:hypothetical protein
MSNLPLVDGNGAEILVSWKVVERGFLEGDTG